MTIIEEVGALVNQWEMENNTGTNVVPTLNRLSEVLELETQKFLHKDPDPFDDRHPSLLQPECHLGNILKVVLRNHDLVDEIIKVYCRRHDIELNIASSRLLLNLLPGLEKTLFMEDDFILKLFEWAENAANPLQSYATGLLAASMDVSELASSHQEKNAHMVPLLIKRLYELSKIYFQTKSSEDSSLPSTSFGIYKHENDETNSSVPHESEKGHKNVIRKEKESTKYRFSPLHSETKEKEKKSKDSKDTLVISYTPSITFVKIPPIDEIESAKENIRECSSSSWTENMFGNYQVFPLTLATQQIHIFQYLTSMAEYQELISHILEDNTLYLIMCYFDFNQHRDVRLAFEALKYLSVLLCHKKIAIEFLNAGGLQLLLKVPRLSIATAGVSSCFYYLGCLEEALEKICLLSSTVISDLVNYALWLLECSYDSSRCHATSFFSSGFSFKLILQYFDQRDGLRKLFNVVSTLDIFVTPNTRNLHDDEVFSNRLTARQVIIALKKYFETHLAILVEENHRTDDVTNLGVAATKAASIITCEAVERNMEILHNLSLTPLLHWKPVDTFVNLDGIIFLLEMISSHIEQNYSGRAEIIKNALDVLKICSLAVSAELKFCEKLSSTETIHVTGISVLLKAAEGEIMPVADAQRAALLTIINCVCLKVPVVEPGSRPAPVSGRKVFRHTEELLNKIWKAVRIKNGIIVLINLLFIKTPSNDADAIRFLACKALCGLARSQNVKQIISKLPLVTGGQLIDLMKEPVLQEKCSDHFQFCSQALELIERVTGAPLSARPEYSINLNKVCSSEVVAKTKVTFHEPQLLQLICDHLSQKGFSQSVQCLKQEIEQKSIASSSQFSPGAFPSVMKNFMEGYTSRNKSLQHSGGKKVTYVSLSLRSLPGSSSLCIPPRSMPLNLMKIREMQQRKVSPCRLQKKQCCSEGILKSPVFSKMITQVPEASYKSSQPNTSLDLIVTEYLRKQHSLCKTPMLACPPFDLFVPHKCPEPHFRRNAPANIAMRLKKQEISIRNGGYGGKAFNTKHIYSRFRICHTFRDEDGPRDFTTCTFLNNNDEPFTKLLIGTGGGCIKLFNVTTAKEILTKNCHPRAVTHIQSGESSSLFISSDGRRVGNSYLWNLLTDIDLVRKFSEVSHMEFGKRNLERLIGTKQHSAVIFDTATFSEIQTFPVENLGNNYMKNRATFDFSDELVLSDGLIYDIRSGEMLHKLDKFNSNFNGVFHPNGREIISNSEIWDIRTFKLLRTVTGLDQCMVTFNKPGNVIYAVSQKTVKQVQQFSQDDIRMKCFYTFDAYDYNTIATVDTKRQIYHLATDLNDRYVANIETVNGIEMACKVYEVGRTKQAGDEMDYSDDTDDDEERSEESDDNEGDNNEPEFDREANDDGDDDFNWFTSGSSSITDDDEVDEADDDDDEDDDEDDDDDDALFSINT